MRILDRYIVRETVVPFLTALGVLTFLFAVRPMMDQAQQLLTRGVPVGTVIWLLVNLLPQALGITLPMAFLIGLLIGFGRLSADREAVAFLACGVSLWRLLRPAMVMATFVALVTLWVMLDAIPAGNQTFREVTLNLVAERSADEIRPGVFYEGFPGKVLKVDAVRPDGRWERVVLAITRERSAPTMVLAKQGQLVLNKEEQRAEIHLTGVSKSMPGAEPGVYDRADTPAGEEIYGIDPDQVFPKLDILPGLKEMTIAELKEVWNDKIRANQSPRNAIMLIHQKFSFPVACLVMGLLGVALGVHTRKDGKFASFALGLGLIFVYYALMVTFENLTKGDQFPAAWARWVPNIVLGVAGLVLIWWRTRGTERSLGMRLPAFITSRVVKPGGAEPTGPGRPVVVIRLPDLGLPTPRLIDLYLLRSYLTVVVLAFTGLLGLFYIGTIVDLSEKLFKGAATTGMLIEFLGYSTPQFVYFLLPVAVLVAVLVTIGALSKTGELTVMRACGVSLYRLAVPLLLCGAIFSGLMFALEENVLGAANKKKTALEDVIRDRPTSVIDITNRHWLAGKDNRIYYYAAYFPKQRHFNDLSVYEIDARGFRVMRHTFVQQAVMTANGWTGGPGWAQTFPVSGAPRREDFQTRALRLDSAKYFDTEEQDARAMTVNQLRDYIRTISASGISSGDLHVELQRKIAMPLMTLIMTLIAVPFGVTTGKRGALYGIGLAIALAFTYQVAFIGFGFLGATELLPPILAAWAPNLLFLAGAAYGLFSVRT